MASSSWASWWATERLQGWQRTPVLPPPQPPDPPLAGTAGPRPWCAPERRRAEAGDCRPLDPSRLRQAPERGSPLRLHPRRSAVRRLQVGSQNTGSEIMQTATIFLLCTIRLIRAVAGPDDAGEVDSGISMPPSAKRAGASAAPCREDYLSLMNAVREQRLSRAKQVCGWMGAWSDPWLFQAERGSSWPGGWADVGSCMS